jgi:hypothetical protein
MSPLPSINPGIKVKNSVGFSSIILLVFCFNLVQIPVSLAQQLTNLRTFFNGERVVITYDLEATDDDEHYRIDLFSSHDNYTEPLTHVTGNVGYNVIAGKGHRVIWDALNALPIGFNREVTIKIKGTVQLAVDALPQTTYKRGGDLWLQWHGGIPEDKVNIVLVRDNEDYRTLAEGVSNSRTYSWKIPTSLRAGKDYAIRVTKADDPAELSKSNTFAIKPRIPIWAKGLVVVGVGAGVWVITQGGGAAAEENLPPITITPD